MSKKTQKMVPLKSRIKKIIQVCGRKFRIVWGEGNIGAQFHTIHPETGGGVILLGDGPKDEYYQLSNVIHKLLELVFTINERRFREHDEKIMFTMDHAQFTACCMDFTRALIETGLIKVNEPGADT